VLKKTIRARLQRQRRKVSQGERGEPLEDVAGRLGLR
jgi:hypothetical protein